MAGIYIHIPFCRQACYYCNFHFSTSLRLKDALIQAILKEIELRSRTPETETIATVYFGGGTPSLLSYSEINEILTLLNKHYHISDKAEITIEANPDDITPEKLTQWKDAGINRLSIGIQSFIERDLKWMNRAHNASQALSCIHLARDAGFDNFSIDLIFGVPGLSESEWEKNIQTAIDLRIPHISSYALTVEPKTALQKMIELKKKENINSDTQAAQYYLLMQKMRQAGYEHYEISNFALPGFRSRHNSSYWQGEKYTGFGPSAHSYNGNERMWNKANNALYIQSIQQDIVPLEKEVLTRSQKLNEYIMTSLRTIEGMDLLFIENNFSENERMRIENLFNGKIKKEKYCVGNNKITLTDEGKLFADAIAVELFL